jgi:hypothetical protein
MFFIACILSVVIIWIFKGNLLPKNLSWPTNARSKCPAVRGMLEDIIGHHGLKYFPVVMTFGADLSFEFDDCFLIHESNLATSVTFALGLVHFFITTTSESVRTESLLT